MVVVVDGLNQVESWIEVVLRTNDDNDEGFVLGLNL